MPFPDPLHFSDQRILPVQAGQNQTSFCGISLTPRNLTLGRHISGLNSVKATALDCAQNQNT